MTSKSIMFILVSVEQNYIIVVAIINDWILYK